MVKALRCWLKGQGSSQAATLGSVSKALNHGWPFVLTPSSQETGICEEIQFKSNHYVTNTWKLQYRVFSERISRSYIVLLYTTTHSQPFIFNQMAIQNLLLSICWRTTILIPYSDFLWTFLMNTFFPSLLLLFTNHTESFHNSETHLNCSTWGNVIDCCLTIISSVSVCAAREKEKATKNSNK